MAKILLHTCCTDCALKLISDDLKPDLYFYNPNIHPRSEYLSRLNAVKKISLLHHLKLIVADWSPKLYFSSIKSTKFNLRCGDCWLLRLSATALYAVKNGYGSFSTTLLSSHYQSKDQIIDIGQKLAFKHNLQFIVPKINCDLKTSGFYKQNYCGCCFSLTERLLDKFST